MILHNYFTSFLFTNNIMIIYSDIYFHIIIDYILFLNLKILFNNFIDYIIEKKIIVLCSHIDIFFLAGHIFWSHSTSDYFGSDK